MAHHRLAFARQVAAAVARRRQLGYWLETMDRLAATPARSEEQRRLKQLAMAQHLDARPQ